VAHQTTTAEAEHQGLPAKAVELGRVFGFSITNSMVASWIVALILIIFARFATRHNERGPYWRAEFFGCESDTGEGACLTKKWRQLMLRSHARWPNFTSSAGEGISVGGSREKARSAPVKSTSHFCLSKS
jgi:hypothetical protein